MVQAALKTPAQAPLRVCPSSNAKCGRTWDNGISFVVGDISWKILENITLLF
jgi:hypothetical protein